MCDPKNPATIGKLLESDSFSRVAESIQVVMGNQFHVFDFLIVRRHRASSHKKKPFQSFQSFKSFKSFKTFQTFKRFKSCKIALAFDDGSLTDGRLSVAQSRKLPRPRAAGVRVSLNVRIDDARLVRPDRRLQRFA